MTTATGEVRAGNSILPNLTIAVADDQDGPNEVMLFQTDKDYANTMEEDDQKTKDDEDDDSPYKNLNTSLTFNTSMSEDGPKIIRPNLKFRRDKEKSVEHMLEKMSTDEQSIPTQELTDLSCLEEPSIIEVEKIIRWVMKYNQTAFDKRKVRPQGMFIVGINELSTEDVLGYFRTLSPQEIEWIDDNSCVLVWEQQDDCIRALLKASKEDSEQSQPQTDKTPDTTTTTNSTDTTTTPSNSSENPEKNDGVRTIKIPKSVAPSGYNNILRDVIIPLRKEQRVFDIQIRLSVNSDKKMRGAQHRSRYYQKHGNPNYKQMKGLLSASMRSRLDNAVSQEEKIKFGFIKPKKSASDDQTQNGNGDIDGQREKPNYDDMQDEDDAMDDDDKDLMRLRASDLNDAVPIETGQEAPMSPPRRFKEDDLQNDEVGFGTMIADRVEKEAKSKFKIPSVGAISKLIAAKQTSVHSRLGNKMEPTGLTISVPNDEMDSSSSSSSEEETTNYGTETLTNTMDGTSMTSYTITSSRATKQSSNSKSSRTTKKSEWSTLSSSRGRDYDRDSPPRDYDRSTSRRSSRSERDRRYERDDYNSGGDRHHYSSSRDRYDDRYGDERAHRRSSSRRETDRYDGRDSRDERYDDRYNSHRDNSRGYNRERSPVRRSSRRDRSRSPVSRRTNRTTRDRSASSSDDEFDKYRPKNRVLERKPVRGRKSASPSSSSDDSSSSSSSSSSGSSSSSDSSSSEDESMTVTMTLPSVRSGVSPRR